MLDTPQTGFAREALRLKTEADAKKAGKTQAPAGSARPLQLIRVRDFAARLGVSLSTIWRMVRAGELDPPLALNPRVKGWEESYLLEIFERLRDERDASR